MELKCYITVTYTMYTRGSADIFTLSPWACGPWASGVYIRQTTHAHGITIKYVPMQNHYLRIKYWQFY